MFNWIDNELEQYLKPFNSVEKNDRRLVLKMLSTKCVYKSYTFNIYMYKDGLVLNNLQ